MRKTIILLLLLGLPLSIVAQVTIYEKPDPTETLEGTWTLDLRPTPDAEGYYQPFVIERIEGNTFSGTFYGSEIKNAILNKNWPKIYFAFSTSDATSEYYHSGYMMEDQLHGMTYCPNREFAAPWTGSKE
ncbi:MAG: hypothetical protein KJO04_05025 [Bacteroidia bacterium]|nr:hypothetical protein [Bacteroidia bacterium]